MNTSQSKSVGCFSRGCLSIVLHSIWILLLFGGLYYAFNSWQLTSNGVEVDAVVVDSGIQSDTEGTSYSPIYEYTYEGQTYQYDSPGSSSTLTYKIGDHATLLIDPSKPDRARENSFAPLWMLPSILIPLSLCLGVFTILLGALLSRYGKSSSIQISP